MQCPEVVERLPELLNGTLGDPEREAVQAHLGLCGACRSEWEDTRLAAAIFDAHLPARAIVALAWGQPPAGVDETVARAHVEECPQCAAELALARESRALESAHEARPRGQRWVWPAAMAAGVAALFFVAGLRLGGGRMEGRLARSEAARQETETSATRLRGEIDRLRQAAAMPHVNLPVLELLPGTSLTREAAGAQEPELALRADDTMAALVLSAPVTDRPLAVELRDAGGTLLWSGSGLRPSPLGGYTLALPTSLLSDGRLRLILRDEKGRPVAELPFRVRRKR